MTIYTLRFLLIGTFFALTCSVWAQDPNLIDVSNFEQLNAIRYDLNGNGLSDDFSNEAAYRDAFGMPSCLGSCRGYELTRALDFRDAGSYAAGVIDPYFLDPENGGVADSEGWDPIAPGRTTKFSAVFDGNGHTISNIYINRIVTYVGLFGHVSSGTIRNLGIVGGSIRGVDTAGGVVAHLYGGSSIQACYSTANVTAVKNESARSTSAGGLVGSAGSLSSIVACYAAGDVTSSNSTSPIEARAGGLLGSITFRDTSIMASYATGNVNAIGDRSGAIAGGLVGYYGFASDYITACYATGNVRAIAKSSVGVVAAGGLVGEANYTISGESTSDPPIESCYSTGRVVAKGRGRVMVGGLVARITDAGVPEDSYFDSAVSNRPSTDEYAKTTSELQSPTDYSGIYASWDMTHRWRSGGSDHHLWDLCSDSQYPRLSVDFDGDGVPSTEEFRNDCGQALPTSSAGSTDIIGNVGSGDTNGEDDTGSGGSTNGGSTGEVGNVGSGESKLINVSNFEQLNAIRYDLDGDGVPRSDNLFDYNVVFGTSIVAGDPDDEDPNVPNDSPTAIGYKLTVDLDFEDPSSYASSNRNDDWVDPERGGRTNAIGWTPIGSWNHPFGFGAVFDGGGHTISSPYIVGLDEVGFFGVVHIGTIRNLGIVGGSVHGRWRIGALAGLLSQSSMTACYATSSVDGEDRVGGLIGLSHLLISTLVPPSSAAPSYITACYATGDVTVRVDYGGDHYAGGLTGSFQATVIRACYATGSVSVTATATGNEGEDIHVGGLAGGAFPSVLAFTSVTACYATGSVPLDGGSFTNSSVGGFIADNESVDVSDCYFDSDTSGITSGPEAQTTTALQSPTDYSGIYADWDNETYEWRSGDGEHRLWELCGSSSYPKLSVDANGDGIPSVEEFGSQNNCGSTSGTGDGTSGDDGTGGGDDTSGGDGTGGGDGAVSQGFIDVFAVPEGSSRVIVYPNPATRVLHFANLSFGEEYMYKMYTYSGRLLCSGHLGRNREVDVSKVSDGAYVLLLQDMDGNEILRSPLLID